MANLVAPESERFRIIAYLKEGGYIFFVRVNYIEVLTGDTSTIIQLEECNDGRNKGGGESPKKLYFRKKFLTSNGK